MSNKRKAAASNSINTADALKQLNRLSGDEKHTILQELIRNPLVGAADVVMKKAKIVDNTPLTDEFLKSFGSRAYTAIHQLDELRCSEQYEMVGTVEDDLLKLMEEAKRYSPIAHLNILCRIAGVFSHSTETGEVFKGISQCGGIQHDLCKRMEEALDSIDYVDSEVMDKLGDAKRQLERAHSRLEDYGIDEFQEVIESIDTKLSEEDEDDVDDDDQDDEDD